MKKVSQKDSIEDKDFMIHFLNNLPKDYDVILNGLEKCHTATGDHALSSDMIHEKLNHWYEKIKNKKEER